jgi:hypothetical protein
MGLLPNADKIGSVVSLVPRALNTSFGHLRSTIISYRSDPSPLKAPFTSLQSRRVGSAGVASTPEGANATLNLNSAELRDHLDRYCR